MMKLAIVLSLALTGSALGGGVPNAAARHHRGAGATVALRIPRGGASGPLDPQTVAKTATAIALPNHVLSWLGPEKTLAFYGHDSPSSANLMIWQRKDAIFLGGTLAVYLMLFHDVSANTAVGYGNFPIVADILRSVLNDDEKKFGLSNAGQLLGVMGPFLLTSYACLQNLENSALIVKICSVYHVIRGIYYMLDPAGACKAWGVKEGAVDEVHKSLVKWLGLSLITHGIGGGLIVGDMDLLKIIGYLWIPFAVYAFYTVFITGEMERKGFFSVWIALALAVIGTTLVF